jgi:hypothetical protein
MSLLQPELRGARLGRRATPFRPSLDCSPCTACYTSLVMITTTMTVEWRKSNGVFVAEVACAKG